MNAVEKPVCRGITWHFKTIIYGLIFFWFELLSVLLWSGSGISSSSCNFFHMINQFDFSVIFFLFLYFTPKLFCFLCIRLLVFFFLYVFSTYILVVFFFFLFWHILFCLDCLTLSSCLLSLPSFANIFWFIFSRCDVKLICLFLFCFVFSCCAFLQNISQRIFSFTWPRLLIAISLPVLQAYFLIQVLYLRSDC